MGSSPGSLLARTRPHLAGLVLAGTGALPVSLIGLAAFGWVSLRTLALFVLVPTLGLALITVACRPFLGRRIGRAIAIGIVATACYDLFRFAFLWVGLMDHDPIPHIGTALGLQPAWFFGYLWRYLGNGGGLALTFVVLGLRGRRIGALYGAGVCAGLLTILVVSPFGTEMLFPLNTATVVMAVVGHLIFGVVLGELVAHGDRTATQTQSSFSMVAMPVSSETSAPLGDDSRSWNVSSASVTTSPVTVTETDFVVSPEAKAIVVNGTAA